MQDGYLESKTGPRMPKRVLAIRRGLMTYKLCALDSQQGRWESQRSRDLPTSRRTIRCAKLYSVRTAQLDHIPDKHGSTARGLKTSGRTSHTPGTYHPSRGWGKYS